MNLYITLVDAMILVINGIGGVVMSYIAHIRASDGEQQALVIHLREVQAIAEQIGRKLNIPHITGLAGLLHDVGKYSDAFQSYILAAYDNPDSPPQRGSVDHSSAGGHFLHKHFRKSSMSSVLIECVANAIYGHHGQLLDFIDPDGKSPMIVRTDKELEEYERVENRFLQEVMSFEEMNQYILQATKELQLFLQPIKERARTKEAFEQQMRQTMTLLTKFIFSVLIDADRTNSRDFDEQRTSTESPQQEKLFQTYLEELEKELAFKQQKAIPNLITELRKKMSDSCAQKADLPTGIYTLSIPTGGGKTLASLRFALNHALKYKKDRIIYIVPYTTIIEQNAEEVRQLLKAKDNVLEHHSNVFEEVDEKLSFKQLSQKRKMQSMKDNWYAPIIFTTMVQFLNTFFSGKSRNERRLHNLANSVIIFDEVQSLPIKCVSLFNAASQFLTTSMGSTLVLCTATQPALDFVKHNIKIDAELVDDLPKVVQAFKRTNIESLIRSSGWSTEELSSFIEERLDSNNNILIIMNNKSVVLRLYEALKECGIQVYHLSTAMCAAHRKKMIEEIRENLKSSKRFVCVSTQLIEAGVDVSFDCVMRSLAGVDSIAQAAGRCNRHGEKGLKTVYVFNHAEENVSRLKTIQEGAICAKRIIADIEKNADLFGGELLSTEAITHYFQQYYTNLKSDLNYPIGQWNTTLYDMLFGKNDNFNPQNFGYWNRVAFQSASRKFEVIEAETTPILVPFGEGEELIAELLSERYLDDVNLFFKKAQQYSVNVFPFVKEQLFKNRLIDIVDLGFAQIYVAKSHAYDDLYGLSVTGEAKMEDYQF